MTASGGDRVSDSRWRYSLGWRLPALSSAISVCVLVVVLYAAYREVETTLSEAGAERARHAAEQVATIFGRSTQRSLDQLQRVARVAALYLREPTDQRLTDARAALAPLAPGPTRRVSVWNAAGMLVFEVPARTSSSTTGDPVTVPARTTPAAPGLSPIQAAGEWVFIDASAAIPDPIAATAPPLGSITLRSPIAVSPPDALNRLVGMDARILFGNRRGDVWTDTQRRAEGPAVDLRTDRVADYRAGDGGRRIGGLSGLPGTQWVVWVEFERTAVVAGASTFLRRMAIFGLFAAAATVILVRRYTIRVTTPLAEMTTAAEALASGDSSRRVIADRSDEIGRLGRAFNVMTSEVADARRGLEQRVEERTNELNAALAALHQRSRASEDRYRTLFDYAPDGIIIADRDSRYIDANASMCEIVGYSHHELIGLHASELVVPESVRSIGSALHAITATSDYHQEWQLRRKDGTRFPADVLSTMMPDGTVMAIIRDVSERNQALDALRAAEERMRFALQNADVGIWDMDFATGRLQWSETIEAHYGLQPGTFRGTFDAFIACVHPDDWASLRETFSQAAKSGADFSTFHRAVWPDGTVRWLSGAGRVLLDDRGEAVRGVGISMDITARRTLEQQYQQAQKLEAIGRLAGGVAHDFNNLLTAILGFGRFVLDSFADDDDRRADMEQIVQAADRASALTRQLLAFSRREVVQPVALKLNKVVVETHKMLRRLIGEDIEIELALAEDAGIVHADPGQLDQIIMNLAVNARDAMPGGGRLTIETANVDLDASFGSRHGPVEPGPYVMLAVTDTGVGMTEDTRRRLFEPFFTTKEAGKGTGLGLATVFGIVKQGGGYLYVSSEPGRGSTFTIYLPRLAATAASATPPSRPPVRSGSETVLLVEDEQPVRLLVQTILEGGGYRVIGAANPREAEIALGDRLDEVDVLVTDVIMPGGTGPALFAQLRCTSPRLRVLYISGYSGDTSFRNGELDPGVAFLQKPFTADSLLRKLREVLDLQPEAQRKRDRAS
jgi:two-component system cell cycle sensor histidine kinase/response regulator CckA